MMKQALLILALWLASTMGALAGVYITPPSGSGTANDPFLITNLNDLCWVTRATEQWPRHRYYKQTADIDANSTALANFLDKYYPNLNWNKGWKPIGTDGAGFNGHYDGQGFVIKNITIVESNVSNSKHLGLFGETNGATITGVVLVNANINTGKVRQNCAGILVGHSIGSTISSCYVMGSVTNADNIGGLVGINEGSTISSCYSKTSAIGIVSGGVGGGLVGKNTGAVTGSFYDRTTAQISDDEGKGTPKITAQMKDIATYLGAGWDFASTWGISSPTASPKVNDGYPAFLRQFTAGTAVPTMNKPTISGATVTSNLTAVGNPVAYEIGFCYSTTNNRPTISDSKVSLGGRSTPGTFSASLNDL